MRIACLAVIGLIGWAAAATAQSQFAADGPPPTVTPAATSPAPATIVAPATDAPPAWTGVLENATPVVAGPEFWAGVEYLRWRLRGSTPPPLVTTGNPLDLDPGAVGQPGTRVLYGGTRENYGTVGGVRLSIGAYLDPTHESGVEGSVFLLGRADTGFAAASTPAGQPSLYLPSYRPDLGRESAVTVSSPNALPGVITGQVSVESQARLLGAQLAYTRGLTDLGPVRVDGLLGAQFLDLDESLRLRTNVNDDTFGVVTKSEDLFKTRNRFYGAVVGARAGAAYGSFTAELTGRLGVGATERTSDISGFTAVGGPGCVQCGIPAGGIFPGGVYTDPTNISRRSDCRCAIVPQLQFKLGYEVCSGVKLTAGYDVLWWNQVAQPGDQIDRVTNQTQRFGGALSGPARPLPTGGTSDFRAQGFSVGLEVQY